MSLLVQLVMSSVVVSSCVAGLEAAHPFRDRELIRGTHAQIGLQFSCSLVGDSYVNRDWRDGLDFSVLGGNACILSPDHHRIDGPRWNSLF